MMKKGLIQELGDQANRGDITKLHITEPDKRLPPASEARWAVSIGPVKKDDSQKSLKFDVMPVNDDPKLIDGSESASQEALGLVAAFTAAMIAGKKTESFLIDMKNSIINLEPHSPKPITTSEAVTNLEMKINSFNDDIRLSKDALLEAEASINKIDAMIQRMYLK